MSDIKLFRISNGIASELEGQSVAVEKSLQRLIEQHLETFFGIRFLASEYGTGKVHGGRIDTLGLDENGAPVIIEYKRALNENVTNFATVVIRSDANKLLVYLPLDVGSVEMDAGYMRDVSDIGHHGTGDLELTVITEDDLEFIKPLLLRSYESN